MKSHIGPEGPSRCKAEKGQCPFEEADSEGSNHFDTIKEARDEWEKRLEKAYESVGSVSVNKRKLSEKEKLLRAKNAEIAKKLVEVRAETSSGIVFEDANPERAKRRLDESIEFANSRHNEHLVKKLSTATVLPSGAFKLEDGARINTDAILKKKLLINHIEKERAAALEKLGKIVRESAPTQEKWQVKTDRGTYSMTVTEGADEEAFEGLSAKLREACSSPKESFNIDLARENIPLAKLREITTTTQTLDFIYGKEAEVGQSDYKISDNVEGKDTDEKLQSGLKNIANFYDEVSNKEGRIKALNDYVKNGGASIKVAAASKQGNVFVPARSQYNGALVSGRTSINAKKAQEILTPEELKSITVVKSAPDIKKAQTVLPEKTFGKIFKAKKVSLRVTETKD